MQKSLPPVGFKPTVAAGKRAWTYPLDHTATGTGPTLHTSSESLQKLPPCESELFTVSLIVSFPINIVCEVFSELILSPWQFMLFFAAQNTNQLLGLHSYCSQVWYEKGNGILLVWRHAITFDKHKCSLCVKVKTRCCATVFLQLSIRSNNMPGMNFIESLILQVWRSLMTHTWSQYFQ
jgi:hypothetical protein